MSKTIERQYEYTVSYLQGQKIKSMELVAESQEHARMIFWNYIENMQAFTETFTDSFYLLSVIQNKTK